MTAPDRPYATLSASELDARIASNRANQAALEGNRAATGKRMLAQLKRDMSALIEERNWREDLQQLPF